jgi:hypothetical protein
MEACAAGATRRKISRTVRGRRSPP